MLDLLVAYGGRTALGRRGLLAWAVKNPTSGSAAGVFGLSISWEGVRSAKDPDLRECEGRASDICRSCTMTAAIFTACQHVHLAALRGCK